MEVGFTQLAILYFCGPLYFLNTSLSLFIYGKITKSLAKERKNII